MSKKKQFLQEIRSCSDEELQMKEKELSRNLFLLFNQKKNDKKLEKPHEVKKNRRDRARVLTILQERRMQEKSIAK